MKPPEPCIKGRCYSPMACNGWGYCRERNVGIDASADVIRHFRDVAKERQAKEEAGS